jgi:hypothetical protein
VYPEKQAREIAERTRTLVLSTDIDYGKLEGWEKATLHGFDERGQPNERTDLSATAEPAATGANRVDYRPKSDLPETARPPRTTERTVGTTGMAAASTTVTAGELSDHPDRYYGKTMSVTAEVEDVYSRSMFSLDEDKLWSTGRDVIVINPRPTAAVTDNDHVTVVGDVRRFTMTELRREFDDLDWDLRPEITAWVAKRPVIVARSIQTERGDELVGKP